MRLFACLMFLNGWQVQGLMRGPSALPELQGRDYKNGNQPLENYYPAYIHYKPPPPGCVVHEHAECLMIQNELRFQTMPGFQSFALQQRKRDSLFDDIKRDILTIHGPSSSVTWAVFSCIVMRILLWQLPSLSLWPSLMQSWVCNRSSIQRAGQVSLILPALYSLIVDGMKRDFLAIYSTSPCVAWTAFSCIVVFILWHLPSLCPWWHLPSLKLWLSLMRNFVCNRASIKRTAGLSLILSAVSHKSLYHLLGNLVTLLGIAPGVARNVTKPLWPLFLGSAVCSNALFSGVRRNESCIGLSGVTMAIFAIQARAAPTQVYQVLLFGIFPVRLQAKYMLYALLGVSFLGSFVQNSGIAHLGHLGGLIFGILYYELYVKK